MLKRALYDEEHDIFRENIKKMYQRELVPYVENWENQGLVSREFWRACGAAGMLFPVASGVGASGCVY